MPATAVQIRSSFTYRSFGHSIVSVNPFGYPASAKSFFAAAGSYGYRFKCLG